MSETNKAIYSRAWQELMNQRNLAIVDELFAPNYVRHDPHFPLSGREALKRFVTALHNGFSYIRFTLDDLIAEGNKVVKRFTLTCTYTGAFRGMPPSAKRLTLTGLTLGRIAHGQILEEWESTDWLGWQQQLGIIPEPTADEPLALPLPGPHLKRRDIMIELQVTTTRGTSTALDEATVQAFTGTLRGALLRPGDARYDSARTVWNGLIDKRPALIVRCAGAADVIAAVRFAREHDLLVSIRSGGHNIAGKAVCDGGLMIDLSRMKSIRVDPVARTVRAEPGVLGGEFDRETQAFGLAAPVGSVSTTGIAGLTLGGGQSWLSSKYGFAIDNLLSVDIVTADGVLRTASTTQHEDLFWAIRGAGHNFGVVTSFEYRLHPVGPVLGGTILHPFARATEVLRFYREFTASQPDELQTWAGILTGPDGNLVVALIPCYVGSLDAGERLLAPLRRFGSPVADTVAPIPYVTMQSLFDAALPPGRLDYWKTGLTDRLDDEVIAATIEYARQVPSPLSVIVFTEFHGAYSRVGKTDTAYYHRDLQYDPIALAVWTDPAETPHNIRWTRELFAAWEPHLPRAVYVNDLGDEGEERAQSAYGENYARLVALKTKYDPTNFFRLNQNIKPTV